MKRILLLNQSIGPGGAERQICGLTIGLKRQGYDVLLVTPRNKGGYAVEMNELGDSYELHTELINTRTRIFRLIKLIRHYRPDIVISYGYSMNLPACVAKIFVPNIKLIVSERNTTQKLSAPDLREAYAIRSDKAHICQIETQSISIKFAQSQTLYTAIALFLPR